MPLTPTRWQRVDLHLERTPDSPPRRPPAAVPPGPTFAERVAQWRREMKERAAMQRLCFPQQPKQEEGPVVTGVQLKQARERVGVPQRELARDLGLHRSQVAEAECGRRRPHPSHARWAARLLHLPARGEEAASEEGR